MKPQTIQQYADSLPKPRSTIALRHQIAKVNASPEAREADLRAFLTMTIADIDWVEDASNPT